MLVLILVKVCACVRLAAVKNHCMCVSTVGIVEMVFFMCKCAVQWLEH